MEPYSAHRYQYDTLGSSDFRLLWLEPGVGDEPLKGHLQIHSLPGIKEVRERSVPNYCALSYAWGQSQTAHNIQCNGSTFPITESLCAALCLVRRPKQRIWVWADAICIDQSDPKERRQQVALMRLIYSTATTVVVCPNFTGNLSRHQQRILARVLSSITHARTKRYDAYSQQLPFEETEAQACELASGIPPLSQELSDIEPEQFCSILAAFFDNPWFSRIWVVQEVAESQECRMLLGRRSIPWSSVVALAQAVRSHPYAAHRVFSAMRTNGIHNILLMNNETRVSGPEPIPALLQSTRGFYASDPRDKVYAVLHKPIQTMPIYAKFRYISSQKYAELALQSMALTCILQFTCELSPAQSQFWCMLASVCLLAYLTKFFPLLQAVVGDFGRRFIDFCSTCDRVILNRMKYSDTIHNALDLVADYSLGAQTLYRWVATRAISRSAKLNMLSYVHHEDEIDSTYPSWVPRWDRPTHSLVILIALPELLCRASADLYHRPTRVPEKEDHLEVEGLRISSVQQTSEVIDWGTGQDPTDYAPTACELAATLGTQILSKHPAQLSHSRRRFATADGSIGFGPRAMEPGDVVYVLFGASVPFVLRLTDRDGMYRLVGECYVVGIMNGQAVDSWRDGNVRKESITLC